MTSHALFVKWMVLIWGVTLIVRGHDAFASSFQLQEQSASGLGVAYSGMAAATQDASTAFWNPAGMSYIPGVELSVAADFIAPKFNFTGNGGPPAGSTYAAFGDCGNCGVSAVLPAIYLRTPITSNISAGVAVNVPFGLSTECNNSWA
jgi:long-chain fatty acid transport protein